jgi:hypothetical protein
MEHNNYNQGSTTLRSHLLMVEAYWCWKQVNFKMEALQQTIPTVYTEVGIPKLFYHISNMFQSSWVLVSESNIKQQVSKSYKHDHVKNCIYINWRQNYGTAIKTYAISNQYSRVIYRNVIKTVASKSGSPSLNVCLGQ